MFSKKRVFVIVSIVLLAAAVIGFAENYSRIAAIGKYLQRVYSAAAVSKETVNFNGLVKATPKGKIAIGISVRQLSADTQMIVFLGRLAIKGKITPTTAGAAVPRKMNLIQRHRSATNQILSTNTFSFNVNADGTIPPQSFAVTLFEVYSLKESQEITVVPVDANLPACRFNLKTTHTIGFSSVVDETREELSEAPAAAPQLVFIFSNFMEDRAQNKVFGPFALKNLSQPGFALNGTMRIKGKITPDPGEFAPSTVKVTLKHKNAQNGAVLSTQTFNIHIEADGRILVQSFPITTSNATGTPEQLEVSAQAVDKAFPFSTVNVTITYTPAV